MWTPAYLTTNPSEECPQADHTLLVTIVPGWRHRVFQSMSPLCLPRLAKNDTLLFNYTQRSVSETCLGPAGRRGWAFGPSCEDGVGRWLVPRPLTLRGWCGSERGSPENPQAPRHHVDALTQTQTGVVRGQRLKRKFRGPGYS